MSMTPRNKIKATHRNQEGVSLMLAVLVLSAITAISFSLAAIIFIEIRSSGDAVRTEPTLYAAFAVTEEALFQYKRFINDENNYDVIDCDADPDLDICTINNVNLSFPGEQPIAFDESPRVEVVNARQIKTVPMFDPYEFTAQQYQEVSLRVLPGGPRIYASFKVTNVTSGDTETIPLGNVDDSRLKTYQISGTGQYELILDNNINPNEITPASVVIYTTRVDDPDTGQPAQPAGLPFVGERVLRIQADYLNLNRTYQVRIPIP